MSYHTNTPTHDKGDVKFQLQDLAKMREMVNLVIGDMSDKFERLENVVIKLVLVLKMYEGYGPEENNNNRVVRPR